MKKYIKIFILVVESAVVLLIILGSMQMLFLENHTLVFSNYWATILGSLLLMVFTVIGFLRYLSPICDWLFLHEHFFSFFLRFIFVFLLGLFLSFYSRILVGAARIESANPILVSTIMEAISFSVVIFWYTFTAFGVIMIILELFLLMANAAVSVLRFIAWRIVEYNKGAWAAISLLLTVAVGILDFWIHLKTK